MISSSISYTKGRSKSIRPWSTPRIRGLWLDFSPCQYWLDKRKENNNTRFPMPNPSWFRRICSIVLILAERLRKSRIVAIAHPGCLTYYLQAQFTCWETCLEVYSKINAIYSTILLLILLNKLWMPCPYRDTLQSHSNIGPQLLLAGCSWKTHKQDMKMVTLFDSQQAIFMRKAKQVAHILPLVTYNLWTLKWTWLIFVEIILKLWRTDVKL